MALPTCSHGEDGRVDMIAALASDGINDKRLHLSRPYLESPTYWLPVPMTTGSVHWSS